MSVPREPVWSLMNLGRGKYLSDRGNAPGHVQRRSSRAFLKLVEGHFRYRRRPSPPALDHGAMPNSPRVRRVLHWLGLGIALLSLYYVGRSLLGHFDQILALKLGPKAVGVALIATILYTCSLVALAASWSVIAVSALPDARQLAIAARIYARSGIAKYLPGNVFHLVGRQVLGRALGASQGRLAVATTAEIVLSLLSVWLIATAVFAVLPGPISRGLSLLALVCGALVAIAFISLGSLRRAAPWAAPILDRVGRDASCANLVLALTLNLAFFLCLAIIAGIVFRALTGEATPVMQVGALYLIAWLVGYIVPGASGGLGVREAALLVLLENAAGGPAVLAFALAMRLQSILADLLFFAASYVLPFSRPAHANARNPQGRHHDPSPSCTSATGPMDPLLVACAGRLKALLKKSDLS